MTIRYLKLAPSLLMTASVLLAGCSQMDMQGVDPKDYYTEHPKINKVETRHAFHSVTFPSGSNRLSGDRLDELRAALNDVRPEAVELIEITVAPSQMYNEQRKEHLSKFLRSVGMPGKTIRFVSQKGFPASQAVVDIAYASVVLPDCPDWRTSPVTTYSNTEQGNFGCASTVNLGLMVADPRDLEKGAGETMVDTQRGSAVINSYRIGQSPGTQTTSGSEAPPDNSGFAQ